ncbi:TIGR02302 family protein [Amorphus sp. 3PC139-8]|uniref:TIGR02302 family protein n=1 Tax=Amorphus sp. 3PC139-8 TaxID=2735676 RepID=UPI00345DE381
MARLFGKATAMDPEADPIDQRIDRLVRRARLSLLWERLWPALALPIGVVALFLALSWLGAWLVTPGWLRISALVVFGVGLLASLVPLARIQVPSAEEAVRRLERQSGVPHRPLTAYRDTLSDTDADSAAQALWTAHRTRMVAALDRVSAKLPTPKLYRRDPYALRAVVGLLLVVALAAGSGEYWQRVRAAFVMPTKAAVEPALRLDAWVSPPAYTSLPPIFLTGTARADAGPISVPAGSELVLRIQGVGDAAVDLSTDRGSQSVATEPVNGENAEGAAGGPREASVLLDTDATVSVTGDGETVDSWAFAVKPDGAPAIRFIDEPQATARGALELRYETEDDYGVTEAHAEFTLVDPPGGLSDDEARRPLIDPPSFALSLPGRRDGLGAARTTKDLSDHPWAGATVEATLVATDDMGQTGRSEPKEFVLPARPFYQPLAQSMIEQRRILAYDAESQPRVIDAISSLMLYPQAIFATDGHYLAVDFAYRQLVAAHDDEALKEVLDALWDVAVMVEDGDLSDAEKALKAAQEKLRQAIENGASEQEIARLTQELREAMNRYMRELAQQAMRSPQSMQQMDPNAQMLSQQDLDRMLSQIEELAKSGARDQAQQLLSEMQRMLENLQAGQPQMMPQTGMGQMEQMLDELGNMIQRQQELMNDTHRLDRQQQGQGRQGEMGQDDGMSQSPQERADELRRLQESQGQLGQSLQELMERLLDQGLQPNQQLGDAGEAMGRAEGDLGGGRPDDAVGEQGQALEQLRQGAQSLAQQMAGNGTQPGGNQSGQTAQGQQRDPLGRFRRNEGSDMSSRVRIPDEIDVQRARRILEELRNRLSDPQRPSLELDYLERLLPGN